MTDQYIDLGNTALAINGGKPVRMKPWLDNITTGEAEKQAAIRVLDNGYLSLFEGSHTPDPPFSFYGGPEVQNLERMWCDYYGSEHAVSMNSATSGLYAAVGALGVGYGDEVIVSPYTMTACAIAPLIYGAIPVFADVDPETGAINAESFHQLINTRTKAIILVHQFGIPADMDRIMAIAREFNIKVVEDCAQAHGAKYKDQFVGTFGDIGVFSLNVNKSIQCGEGAVCLTDDDDIAYRLALIRNHGEAVVGPANYRHIENIAGYNYRLSEIHAAIAAEQLKKLDTLNKRRLDMVDYFIESISDIAYLSPMVAKSTYYIVPVRFDQMLAGVDRKTYTKALNGEGALFYQGYTRPLYLQPMYQQRTLYKFGYPFTAPENQQSLMRYDSGTCPVAEKLHFEEVLINEHIRPPQTLDDIKELVSMIRKLHDTGPGGK
jgi:perosamine synthetase